MESLGLKVSRLIRISYGPFALGDLDENAVAEVPTAELKKALGPTLIDQAEADFEAPIEQQAPLIPAKAGIQKDRAERHDRTGSPPSRGRAGEGVPNASTRPLRGPSSLKGRGQRKGRASRPDRGGGPRPSRPRPK
jgi:23S rRNA pseudouridine2605 synthase